jgi:hypothetical protein
MLTPDEKLAMDILDALDARCRPAVHPICDPLTHDERCRLEQKCRMLGALSGWLKRWMRDPRHDHLRMEGDSLWETVVAMHEYLTCSQDELLEGLAEIDEEAQRL